MQRRTAVKYLFVVATGSALLPSCLNKTDKTSIPLKHLDIDANDEKLIAEIGETIVPAGAAPGAKDTYTHLFVMRMLDDCYNEEEQKKFVKALKAVDDLSQKKFGTSFCKCTAPQRNEIIAAIENKKAPEEVVAFYQLMKSLTVQGYLSSKPVLGDIFHYELVPARYNGFFPAKTITHQV
jgi:hypothetical protein